MDAGTAVRDLWPEDTARVVAPEYTARAHGLGASPNAACALCVHRADACQLPTAPHALAGKRLLQLRHDLPRHGAQRQDAVRAATFDRFFWHAEHDAGVFVLGHRARTGLAHF